MFDDIFNFIDTTIAVNIATNVALFMEAIRPFMGACVVVYAVYLAYSALYSSQFNILDSIKFVVTLAFISSIALNSVYYLNHVVPFVLTSGDWLSNKLVGGGGGGAVLQTMLTQLLVKINLIFDGFEFDFFNSDTYIDALIRVLMVFLFMVGGMAYIAVAAAYLLVAKIMVSLLLIVGPLFIMFAFFPSTRSFFQAWTGQCFNYMLLTLLYPIAFTIFSTVIDKVAFQQTPSFGNAVMGGIVFFIALIISLQIPTFCSSLSGGIGINGIVGSFSGAASTLGNGLTGGKFGRKLGKEAGGKIGGGLLNGLNKLRNKSNIKAG